MKLRNFSLALAAAALAMLPAAVLAQSTVTTVPAMNSTDVFQDVVAGQGSATAQFASALQMRSFTLAQNSQHLTAPTLTTSGSGCGGSTATVNGTDTSGQLAEGSSASTSCVVTFAKAFATAPLCFVSLDNVADTALKCHTTTTAMTVTQTSASSNVMNYMVVGVAGG